MVSWHRGCSRLAPQCGLGLQGEALTSGPETRRISVRVAPRVEDWSEGLVYVGRGDRKRGLPPSIWGNPHKVRDGNREAAVQAFRLSIAGNGNLLDKLPKLRGRTLVCHL